MKLCKGWIRGDVLRVNRIDPEDPAIIGDLVTHDDENGSSVPYCITPSGERWAFVAEDQLEFVCRPSDSVAVMMPHGTEAKVCALIAQRKALGVKKYGMTVSDNPLGHKQWLQHALEEALDMAVYLQVAIEEIEK